MAVPKTLQAGRIMAMPAGRELDAMVAERVMGWKRFSYMLPDGTPDLYPPGESEHISSVRPPPAYSTDIAAAWIVAEWLRERWDSFSLSAHANWLCTPLIPARDVRQVGGSGDTPELAICRAALLTVME